MNKTGGSSYSGNGQNYCETEVYDNTKQGVIQISKDRLELNTKQLLEHRINFISNIVLAITSITAYVSDVNADSVFGINYEIIKIVYLIIFIYSVYKFLTDISKFFSNKYLNVESFIELCADESNKHENNFVTRICIFFKRTFKRGDK